MRTLDGGSPESGGVDAKTSIQKVKKGKRRQREREEQDPGEEGGMGEIWIRCLKKKQERLEEEK